MPRKLKWLHHNDQCKINLSEIYNFLSSFKIENVRLKRQDESKCDWKISQKINRAHHVKLSET